MEHGHLNAWGEPIEPEDPDDEYYVPPEKRRDIDEGPGSDALDDETGDDMEGWEPDELPDRD